jgi:hypothetical protein
MPDFTKVFQKAYDVKRTVLQPRAGELTIYDNDGQCLQTITKGWFSEEISGEEIGGRIIELKVTDLDESDFSDAVFFGFGGYRYERNAPANPPTGNPRQWIWRIVPVGVEP